MQSYTAARETTAYARKIHTTQKWKSNNKPQKN